MDKGVEDFRIPSVSGLGDTPIQKICLYIFKRNMDFGILTNIYII